MIVILNLIDGGHNMQEIDKMRLRLKNIGKNVTEYKMSVLEAKNLIDEFSFLEKKLSEKQITVIPQLKTIITSDIIDGGSF